MAAPFSFLGPQVMQAGIAGPQGAIGPGGGIMNHMMDPSANNQPLQFNMNKGKPPMAVPVSSNSALEKPDGPGGLQAGSSDGMGMHNTMIGPGPMGFGPMMGPMAGGDMMVMNTMGYGFYGGIGMGVPVDNTATAQKEVIQLKSCFLYPPPPDAPLPGTRERPPGCKTIFIGGLPEKCTEEVLKEIFETAGSIVSLRLSKKNFAHIRFDTEEAVDKSLYISGYRMKIDDNDEKAFTGRIHVDYAQARDDLYEWECAQRMYAREERHRMRMEEDRLKPPSPPPIIHFSEIEASNLLEQVKSDESFMRAASVLITWFERGDCTRRSANHFYSLVQSVNVHIRRLVNEKSQHDTDLEQMKLKFRQRLEGIIRQFEQIEKVFTSAVKQKSWDHFSKAQRKNIDVWHKQSKEVLAKHQDDFLKGREEAEMEMSDSEDADAEPSVKKKKEEVLLESAQQWQLNNLQEENKDLKFQLEAYKNEVELLKGEVKGSSVEKDKQIKQLKDALQGMQQQLISAQQEKRAAEKERDLVQNSSDRQQGHGSREESEERTQTTSTTSDKVISDTITSTAPGASLTTHGLTGKEARLIGLISTFLHVHPFGASIDYIYSYLTRCEIKTRSSEIEELLERLPSVFEQELTGVGAMLEKRWKFIGFSNSPDSK